MISLYSWGSLTLCYHYTLKSSTAGAQQLISTVVLKSYLQHSTLFGGGKKALLQLFFIDFTTSVFHPEYMQSPFKYILQNKLSERNPMWIPDAS